MMENGFIPKASIYFQRLECALCPKKVSTSSAGHELAAGEWLDLHFEVSRVQYEAMIRAVALYRSAILSDRERVLGTKCREV